MNTALFSPFFTGVSWFFVVIGVVSFFILLIDVARHPQKMKVMNWVWPLNALWGSVLILWVYFSFGRSKPGTSRPGTGMDMGGVPDMKKDGMDMQGNAGMSMNTDGSGSVNMAGGGMSMGGKNAVSMDMNGGASGMAMQDSTDMSMEKMDGMRTDGDGMDMPGMGADKQPFWQKVVAGTLHCGSGCTLADLIGTAVFYFLPFAIFGSLTAGEWTLDYIIALLLGVTCQYAALAPMASMVSSIKPGFGLWVRALKIDFFSLTSWQIGMYIWMGIVIALYGRISPSRAEFWFMMQVAMFAGFIIAYPVNWLLIKKGVKKTM